LGEEDVRRSEEQFWNLPVIVITAFEYVIKICKIIINSFKIVVNWSFEE
jgi:hypothetical protein